MIHEFSGQKLRVCYGRSEMPQGDVQYFTRDFVVEWYRKFDLGDRRCYCLQVCRIQPDFTSFMPSEVSPLLTAKSSGLPYHLYKLIVMPFVVDRVLHIQRKFE